jgi:hypothetical protein
MAIKGTAKGRSRRREGSGPPIRWKAYKQYFLIVCEDQKTEPAYFESFRIHFPDNTLYLHTLGTGNAPLGVVNSAIAARNQLSLDSNREIDFTWVVFDKDNADDNQTTISNFHQAYQLAKAENINIALSNEVFELWFLVHFTDVQPDVSLP